MPGEDNPFMIRGTSRVGGNSLIPEERDLLGKPSPSPAGFRGQTGAWEAW